MKVKSAGNGLLTYPLSPPRERHYAERQRRPSGPNCVPRPRRPPRSLRDRRKREQRRLLARRSRGRGGRRFMAAPGRIMRFGSLPAPAASISINGATAAGCLRGSERCLVPVKRLMDFYAAQQGLGLLFQRAPRRLSGSPGLRWRAFVPDRSGSPRSNGSAAQGAMSMLSAAPSFFIRTL